MNFASYSDFREKVRALVEGDEIGETFSTTTLDLIIGLAEQRIYRELRPTTTHASVALTTVSGNALALPSDCMALDTITIGGKQVEVIDLWRLLSLNESSASADRTVFCARQGENLIFFPAVADSTSITLSYYARPADIEDGINTTVSRYPEVFLYGAVAEAMPFLGEDSRVGLWEQKYAQAMRDALADNRWRAYDGSPIRVRTR